MESYYVWCFITHVDLAITKRVVSKTEIAEPPGSATEIHGLRNALD